MTRMTKQMLADENTRLRAHANHIESLLASRDAECEARRSQLVRSVNVAEDYRTELRLASEKIVHLSSRINDLENRLYSCTDPTDEENSHYLDGSEEERAMQIDRSKDIGKPFMMGGKLVQKYRVNPKVVAYRPVGH